MKYKHFKQALLFKVGSEMDYATGKLGTNFSTIGNKIWR